MKMTCVKPKEFKWVAMIVLAFWVSSCGDVTSGTGDFGRVSYSLYTKYVVDGADINEVQILAGYPQEIRTQLTALGSDDVEDPGELTHRVSPKEGATLVALDDGFDVPDVTITVTEPGTYTLETMNAETLFDQIQLNFAAPDSLDVITWVRRSSEMEFSKVSADGTILVDEGTQVTVIPIPVGSDGRRVVGDFEAVISATPGDLVVATENILGAYEQSIWSSPDPISVVFIDPGIVEIVVEDAVNGVSKVLTFEVAE